MEANASTLEKRCYTVKEVQEILDVSYNRYILEYQSVLSEAEDAVQTTALMETSFAEVSFPTVVLPVHSYIGDMMEEEDGLGCLLKRC